MLNDFKKSYYCDSNWSYSHTSIGRWVDQLTQTFQASQNTPDAIATDGGFQRVIRGVNFDIICWYTKSTITLGLEYFHSSIYISKFYCYICLFNCTKNKILKNTYNFQSCQWTGGIHKVVSNRCRLNRGMHEIVDYLGWRTVSEDKPTEQ